MILRPPAIGVLAIGLLASVVRAQEIGPPPDARVVPRGALRMSFEPLYLTYDQLFDSAGTVIPFGQYLSADSIGVGLFPALATAQAAVRDLSGDSTFTFDAGKLTTSADGDIRHFPFSAAFGLTRRLTFTATVPIVVTRVRSFFRVDSTGANAGLNTGITSQAIGVLVNALGSETNAVDANIAAGNYGCPTGASCDAARATVARARQVIADLIAISGAGAPQVMPIPPFAPLAGSSVGIALIAAVNQIRADLASLGATPAGDTLQLPSARPDTAQFASVLSDPQYGYDAAPLNPSTPIKRAHVGDVTLGLRYALMDGAHVRTVLYGTARLPTGSVDSADDFLDLPTGTHALGLTGGLEAAIEPGTRIGLTLAASYTRQFSTSLERRIAFPTAPIALAGDTARIDRRLGDVLQAGVYPSIRLNPAFQVYGSVNYYHKGADVYSAVGPDTLVSAAGAHVADLGRSSTMTSWSFGGGIWYHATHGRRARSLPIEAGVGYRAAFAGSGGFTPKGVALTFSLRLFYRLWGAPAAESPPPPPDQAPAPAKSPARTH